MKAITLDGLSEDNTLKNLPMVNTLEVFALRELVKDKYLGVRFVQGYPLWRFFFSNFVLHMEELDMGY